MMTATRLVSITLLALCPALLSAQAPAATPAVSFNLDASIVPPTHYSITVASDGSSTYESTDAQKKEADALDPYQLKFTMSGPTLKKIFALTEAANHFHGDFAFKGKTAHTGTKTLRYTDQNLDLKQSYEWSQDPSVQQLTTIFEGIALVQESARRLRFLRRFDKLSVDAELKGLERLSDGGEAFELHTIAPLLQQIINDVTLLKAARERARVLLERAQNESQPASPGAQK
jgi:hypothetical protein